MTLTLTLAALLADSACSAPGASRDQALDTGPEDSALAVGLAGDTSARQDEAPAGGSAPSPSFDGAADPAGSASAGAGTPELRCSPVSDEDDRCPGFDRCRLLDATGAQRSVFRANLRAWYPLGPDRALIGLATCRDPETGRYRDEPVGPGDAPQELLLLTLPAAGEPRWRLLERRGRGDLGCELDPPAADREGVCVLTDVHGSVRVVGLLRQRSGALELREGCLEVGEGVWEPHVDGRPRLERRGARWRVWLDDEPRGWVAISERTGAERFCQATPLRCCPP